MSDNDSGSGFRRLICEEDTKHEEHRTYTYLNRVRLQVFPYCMTPWSLGLLAAVLLIVDIGLGAHYHKLKEAFLTLDDAEYIGNELSKLQDAYQSAIKTMKDDQRLLDIENSLQRQTNWEFEHQTRRSQNYEAEFVRLTKDISKMSSYLPMIEAGCRHCPMGWILMNSLCYYFSFSDGYTTWQKAREFCQSHGGDLAVIDSKDKENSTVNHLIDFRKTNLIDGFWIGLKDTHEEGTWRWLNGTVLVEGYWDDGEPNDVNNEDCAAMYPKENFFKAWNDLSCDAKTKWICEKAPLL